MKKLKNKAGVLVFAFFLISSLLSAQEEGQEILEQGTNLQQTDIIPNLQLAISSPDYLVTAGDVYTLGYTVGSVPVTYRIAVDSSYRIRVSNLGVINAAGKTFRQLRTEVETIVANNYPLSGVQLIMTQPGVFRVFINGEVHTAVEVSAWALARLSVLSGHMTAYASNRNVTIKSVNGQVGNYDLFQASRLGKLSEDPYLRPDDIITFNRLERKVTINGAVERPGVYQLLADENLRDLIDTYAHGFTPLSDKGRINLVRFVGSASISGDRMLLSEANVRENYALENYDIVTIPDITSTRPVATVDRLERIITLEGAVRRPGTYNLLPHEHLLDLVETYGDGLSPLADPTRMEVIRYVNSDSTSGSKVTIGEEEITGNYQLENYDTVIVPTITQLRPVFFIEGAVGAAAEAALTASNRFVVPFNKGEYYSSVVRRNREWFSAVSDTQNAYIIRDGDRLPINLNRILYDADYRGEVIIEENDTLLIPFRQYFVTVAGAVVNPGRYPYIPDREWDYYIALAGGFSPGQNAFKTVTIRDISGKRLRKPDGITPETIITARHNNFLYYFNQFAPVITTMASIIMTFLTISAMTNQ
jgi:protein involved in polysaccharide export with SLBB domain